jgi:hypothetical protein
MEIFSGSIFATEAQRHGFFLRWYFRHRGTETRFFFFAGIFATEAQIHFFFSAQSASSARQNQGNPLMAQRHVFFHFSVQSASSARQKSRRPEDIYSQSITTLSPTIETTELFEGKSVYGTDIASKPKTPDHENFIRLLC